MAQSFMIKLPNILKAGRNIKSEEIFQEVFYNDMLNYLSSIYRNSFSFYT